MGQQKHVKCDECLEEAFVSRENWRAELRGLKWTTQKEIGFFCESCSAKHKAVAKNAKKKKDADFSKIAKSGARRSLIPGQVFEELKRGDGSKTPKYEPVTPLGHSNLARFLMSSKLSMRDQLRAVGNLYGGMVQLSELGHGNTFAQESVDGGKHGAGGGVTPAMIEARQIAGIAQQCMKGLPVIRHRANSRKYRVGSHSPISARQLVDLICVHQFDMKEVAMRFGWWVEVQSKNAKLQRIPKQQSQKLKAALIDALEAIDEAFQEYGIDAQRIGVLKVR